jgi:hypothetical protein
MKNKISPLAKRIVTFVLFFLLISSMMFLSTRGHATPPKEIGLIFPDPVLAERVALNLNKEVTDVVYEEDLLAVEVLNFSPDEQVTDFTGIDRLQNLEHLYLDYHGRATRFSISA